MKSTEDWNSSCLEKRVHCCHILNVHSILDKTTFSCHIRASPMLFWLYVDKTSPTGGNYLKAAYWSTCNTFKAKSTLKTTHCNCYICARMFVRQNAGVLPLCEAFCTYLELKDHLLHKYNVVAFLGASLPWVGKNMAVNAWVVQYTLFGGQYCLFAYMYVMVLNTTHRDFVCKIRL